MCIDITPKPFAVRKSIGMLPAGATRIKTKQDLFKSGLSLAVITELYNSLTRGQPVARFADREAAVDQAWRQVERELSLPPTPAGEEDMSETATATRAPRKRAASKTGGGKKTAAKGERKVRAYAETETVKTVVAKLRRQNGATKAELEEAVPAAKPAYLNALVTRVLPEKGYQVSTEPIEGARAKRYFIPSDKGPDIDAKKA